MIHTFPSCNLRAGRCVRSSLSEVPLGPQMYVSHCWHQLRVAQGPCASTGRPPTGTFMLSGPIDQREATFRVAARSLASFGLPDSGAVLPTALRAYRKLSWPIRARGAEIGGRVCLGTRVYWYVCACTGMYCIPIHAIHTDTYIYVQTSEYFRNGLSSWQSVWHEIEMSLGRFPLVAIIEIFGIGMYWYVLVCIFIYQQIHTTT